MKENKLIQFLHHEKVNFVLVGVLCFFVEYFTLELFYYQFDFSLIISNALAFYIATFLGYFLNKKYTFRCPSDSVKLLFAYILLSVAGVGLNTVVFLFAHVFIPWFLVCKMIATLVVMVFNYVTRKVLFADMGGRLCVK